MGVGHPPLRPVCDLWLYHRWMTRSGASTTAEAEGAPGDFDEPPWTKRQQLLNTSGLVWVLARKNFQVRYKRATLGVLWAVLQPAVQAAVLVFVFSRVIDVGHTEHYALFVLCGVLSWAFFAQSVAAATTSVVDNEALVKKVALPLAVFPLSAVGGTTLAFLAAMPILLVGAVLSGTVGWHLLLLPVVLLVELALVLSVGVLTASLHPAFRDVKYLVESSLLIGFYATPILYDPAKLTGTLPDLLPFNPMTGVLTLYRTAVLGQAVDVEAVAITGVATVTVMLLAVFTFRRRSDEFADLV